MVLLFYRKNVPDDNIMPHIKYIVLMVSSKSVLKAIQNVLKSHSNGK